jgi:N-acyl-D-aspartate/D-glutamate deacylase
MRYGFMIATQPLARLGAVIVIAAAVGACDNRQAAFDVMIAGGTLIDGAGGNRRADVAINGDRIAAIGDLRNRRATVTIDASDKIVAPGFIDVDGRSGVALLADGNAESHLRQGITSELLGDHSPAFWTAATADADALRRRGLTFDWSGPGGYFRKLEAHGIAINVGTLVPLSAAAADRDASRFIDARLREGAFGIFDDTGATAADLAVAAPVVGRNGAVIATGIGSPIARSDDTLFPVASQAHRVLLGGMARVPLEGMTEVLQRFTRAGERQIVLYAAVDPYPDASGNDNVVRAALRYGGVIVGTGTSAMNASTAPASAPREAFGTFPRLLGQLARDEHAIDLAGAVARSTSVPASLFQISERGIIREKYFADIVVFDQRTIADRTTTSMPNQYPAGIEYVVVNGVVVLTPKGLTGARPGDRLLHNGAAR